MNADGLPDGGNCYEVAANLMLDLMRYPHLADNKHNIELCHAEPLGQGPINGIRHGHAWLEFYDTYTDMVWVIDYSNGKQVEMPQVMYYKVGHIEPEKVKRYKQDEVPQMLLEHEHYGPWEDE